MKMNRNGEVVMHLSQDFFDKSVVNFFPKLPFFGLCARSPVITPEIGQFL